MVRPNLPSKDGIRLNVRATSADNPHMARFRASVDVAGLIAVALGAVLVSATVRFFPVGAAARDVAWETAAGLLAVGATLALVRMTVGRTWPITAGYPLMIFGALAIMGGNEVTLGQAYGGLFITGFVFVGLYLPRGSAVALSVPAAACWWINNGGFDKSAVIPVLLVRLGLALSIWVGVAELLAARAATGLSERTRLVEEASRDPLTGLFNRRQLPYLFAESTAGDAYVLIDFDHFKAVNDRLGHDVGDTVLAEFGALVSSIIRRDDAALRYGGEEILVYLRQPGVEQLPILISRLREAWWRQAPATSYSAGVAIVADGERPNSTVSRADTLLYEAKQAGRNRDTIEGRQPAPTTTSTASAEAPVPTRSG